MVIAKLASAPTPEQVRAARKAAGLTQDEAGKLVSTDWKGWQQWEYGKRNMRRPVWELFLIKTKSARKSAK